MNKCGDCANYKPVDEKPKPEFEPYAAVRVEPNISDTMVHHLRQGTVVKIVKHIDKFGAQDSARNHHHRPNIAPLANPAEVHHMLHELGYGESQDTDLQDRYERLQQAHSKMQSKLQRKINALTEALAAKPKGGAEKVLDELEKAYLAGGFCDSDYNLTVVGRLRELRAKYTEGKS